MEKVEIIESERGWGQRVDEVMTFDTKEQAEKFCRDYNSLHNTPMDAAPDWYMYARLASDPYGPMLR
jgi:hypothetical protein